MSDAGKITERYATAKAFVRQCWARSIDKIEGFANKPIIKKEPENPVDRAARRTAAATIAIALFTVVLAFVGYLQYVEIRDTGNESSGQTDQMIREYRAQVAQLNRQAAETHDLAGQTKDLAEHMKDQANETKTIAQQAVAQANAAQRSAQVAANAMEAANRPWLDIQPSIAGPLTFDDSGSHLPILIETRNVGHSPAVRVIHNEEFIQVLILTPNPSQEIKRLCEASGGQSAVPGNRRATATIFPGIPTREGENFTLTPEEMARVITPTIKSPYIYPAVVWCVAYRADFSEVEHHTGYAWRLMRSAPNLPGGIGLIDPKAGPIPGDQLIISPYWPYGPLAD